MRRNFFLTALNSGASGPVNTLAPSIITGSPRIGTQVSGDDGTWTAGTLTYQWQRNISGVWTNISGATSKNYNAPSDADFGLTLRLAVTANGSVTAYSNATSATLAPSGVIMWLPTDETSGTVAADASGNSDTGAYGGGFTLNQSGIRSGSAAVLLDGTNGRINLLPGGTSLATNFNGQEFTFGVYAQCATVAWSDGTEDEILKILSGANGITIRKPTGGGGLNFIYVAGGVTKTVSPSVVADSLFHYYAVTISKANDQMIASIDGVQVGSTQTGLGTWSGAPTTMVVGAQSSGGATPWNGKMAHPSMYTRPLTAQEVLCLANPLA